MENKPLFEVCCATMGSVSAAAEAGAERIELCKALECDGLTPDIDTLTAARKIYNGKINVLIRCRDGNFVYTDGEVEQMCREIASVAAGGADGIVIGALTPEGDIDTSAVRKMMDSAPGLSVTFHRAFDKCADPFKALEEIIGLGCDRILTSGTAATAFEGEGLLRELVERAAGRIKIMAGAGVNSSNAAEIHHATGCDEMHGSARRGKPDSDITEIKEIIESLNK